MAFGVCDVPEAGVAPAPGAVAHDSSFALLVTRPTQFQWVLGVILVAIGLQL